jgi:hypothetical protein
LTLVAILPSDSRFIMDGDDDAFVDAAVIEDFAAEEDFVAAEDFAAAEDLAMIQEVAMVEEIAIVEEVAMMEDDGELHQETAFLVPNFPAPERQISSSTPLCTRPTFAEVSEKVLIAKMATRKRFRPQFLQLPKEFRRS